MTLPADNFSCGDGVSAGAFSTTHWSVVLGAGQTDAAGASAALERLCRTY